MNVRLRVFLLFLLGVLLLIIGYCFLMDIRPFDRRILLYGKFSEVNGLSLGAPVLFRGMKAGEVSEMEIDKTGKNILVSIRMEKDFPVPADSRLMIYDADLLGSKALELWEGKSPLLAKRGDTLQGEHRPGLNKNIIDLIENFEEKLDSALGRN